MVYKMLLARRKPYLPTYRMLSTRTTQVLKNLDLAPNEINAGIYNGSKWIKGSGAVLESKEAATGETLARIATATREETLEVLKHSRQAQEEWRLVPAPRRGEIIRQIRNRLASKLEDLGALVSLEMGKILPEGIGEVQEALDIYDYAVGLSRSISGTTTQSERPGHFLMEVPNPLGVVGVISAFNFPVAVHSWNFSLSFICGNSTIWKPAPSTSLCGIASTKIIASVLEENNLPAGIAALVCGETEVGQALSESSEVDLLSFTGSEKIGKIVGSTVQSRFGKVLLELGGNNCAVVMPDADISLAARTVFFGAVGTAGQRCTSTRRLLLHTSIADKFLAELKKAYSQVKIGHPLDNGVLCGPLHSSGAKKGFQATLKACEAEGGKVLVGGELHKPEAQDLQGGHWVKPTIVFHGENSGAHVMQEECFAPILHVATFDTLEQAIEINNSVRQGLSSTLFTRDMRNVFQWTGPAGSDCGIVNVNQSTSGAEIGGPFGGNKATGWGRESGGDAWRQYNRMATCTINYTDELPLAQGIKFS